MAWADITKPALGSSTKKSLIDQIIDNLDWLKQNAGTAGPNLIQNGSFESGTSPSDPASWVSGPTWGSQDIETTDVAHGKQAYKFVSGGSGGGVLTTTDKYECGENGAIRITFHMKAVLSVGGQHLLNIIRVYFFQKDGSTPTTPAYVDAYSDQTENPESWQVLVAEAETPANARYFQIAIHGADSGNSNSGTVYVDGVTAVYQERKKIVMGGVNAEPGYLAASATIDGGVPDGTAYLPIASGGALLTSPSVAWKHGVVVDKARDLPVRFYSGAGGTGSLLATINLAVGAGKYSVATIYASGTDGISTNWVGAFAIAIMEI